MRQWVAVASRKQNPQSGGGSGSPTQDRVVKTTRDESPPSRRGAEEDRIGDVKHMLHPRNSPIRRPQGRKGSLTAKAPPDRAVGRPAAPRRSEVRRWEEGAESLDKTRWQKTNDQDFKSETGSHKRPQGAGHCTESCIPPMN